MMKNVVICLALALVACNKKADKPADKPATGSAQTMGSAAAGSAMAGSAEAGSAAMAGSAAAPAPDANADHITVFSHHKEPKPIDPVKLTFEKYTVTKADFDPKKIEGGKATIEIDLSSFKTDSDKRDGHVKSPAYLDVGKFATATVDIDNVKKKDGQTYTADAKVSVHGQSKTYPVTFDVLEAADDHIKIKGTQDFSRLDFGVGTDTATDKEQQVANDLKIEMVLTLTKK
ncbi:MAG: YceI family protein [Kofleriaceae bacterium]